MRIYLDTEFNGHGGELISIALVDQHGEFYYGAAPTPKDVHPWVRQHVMPWVDFMGHPAPLRGADMKRGFHSFLMRRPGAEVYADWPADFAHFANMMAGDTFEQALNWQGKMVLIQTPPGEPQPDFPHNALSDAMALMEWCEAQHAS